LSSWLLARAAEPSEHTKSKERVFFGWTPACWKRFFILAHTTQFVALLGILGIKRFEAGPVLLPPKIQRRKA